MTIKELQNSTFTENAGYLKSNCALLHSVLQHKHGSPQPASPWPGQIYDGVQTPCNSSPFRYADDM